MTGLFRPIMSYPKRILFVVKRNVRSVRNSGADNVIKTYGYPIMQARHMDLP